MDLKPTLDGVTCATMELEWTAPGNDGSSGRAHLYDIRYSHEPMKETEYLPYLVVPDIPEPIQGGQTQSLELDWLGPGTHYFAIVTYDDVYNQSRLSNVVEVIVFQCCVSIACGQRDLPEVGFDLIRAKRCPCTNSPDRDAVGAQRAGMHKDSGNVIQYLAIIQLIGNPDTFWF